MLACNRDADAEPGITDELVGAGGRNATKCDERALPEPLECSCSHQQLAAGLLVLTLVALLSFVLTLVVVRNRALECTDVDTTGGPWVPVEIYGGSVHGGAGADRR